MVGTHLAQQRWGPRGPSSSAELEQLPPSPGSGLKAFPCCFPAGLVRFPSPQPHQVALDLRGEVRAELEDAGSPVAWLWSPSQEVQTQLWLVVSLLLSPDPDLA